MKKISLELLQKILNYLAQRPYIETFQMIQEIGNLEDVEKKKETSELKKPE